MKRTMHRYHYATRCCKRNRQENNASRKLITKLRVNSVGSNHDSCTKQLKHGKDDGKYGLKSDHPWWL